MHRESRVIALVCSKCVSAEISISVFHFKFQFQLFPTAPDFLYTLCSYDVTDESHHSQAVAELDEHACTLVH